MIVLAHSIKSDDITLNTIKIFLNEFKNINAKIFLTENLGEILKKNIPPHKILNSQEIKETKIDFILCFGGDGTVLTSLDIIKENNIPIIGINTGSLGFLAKVSKRYSEKLIYNIQNKNYNLSERNILEVSFGNKKMYALNEVTMIRKTAEILEVNTYINDKYLATYRSDGLIISTSTGSTAYSLSCGGPIISPDVHNFIITPIAPHNLNLRPIIISDNSEILCKISHKSTQEKEFKLSADSKFESVKNGTKIKIRKAHFKIKILEFIENDFFSTIREKLLWGEDYRKK